MCEKCPKSFRKPSDLCRHLRTHSLAEPIQCNSCPRTFTSKSTFLTHFKVHQSKPNVEKTNVNKALPCVTSEDGQFLIPTVPKTNAMFKTSGRDFVERPHRCETCGAGFKKASHLRGHLVTHTKEKLFQCDKCDK